MTEVRNTLSPEERVEYDEMFYAATHDDLGKRRKPADVGVELLRLLRDAEQAGRQWATWIIDDATLTGLKKSAMRWAGTKEIIQTPVGERTVTKPAAYGLKRQAANGAIEQLRLGWDEMTSADLRQLMESRSTQIEAERDTIAIAARFVALLERTGVEPVGDALKSLGITMAQFLADGQAAA